MIRHYRQYYWAMALLLIALFVIIQPTIGQSESTVRLHGARYSNQTLVIHVAVPSGTTIDGAQVTTSDADYDLQIPQEQLPVQQWFLLDAGLTTINTYPAFAESVLQLVSETSQNILTRIVIYSDEVSVLPANNLLEEVESSLNEYAAVPTVDSCLYDALDILAEQIQTTLVAQRILVFAGDNEFEQCSGDLDAFTMPIDVIVVGNQAVEEYQVVTDATGGILRQSSLRGLDTVVAAQAAMWQNDFYALSVTLDEALINSNLVLNLSDGSEFSLHLNITGEFTIVEATATTIPSPQATNTDMPIVASDTPMMTPTSEPSETATNTPEVTETEIAISINPTEIPAETVPDEPLVSNTALIFFGGVAAVAVVIAVMAILLDATRRSIIEQQAATRAIAESTQTGTNISPIEGEFDKTEAVKMREMFALVGPTLVAALFDEENDNRYEIHRPVTTLGRQDDSDILIENDRQISREHVQFVVNDDDSVWMTRITQNPIMVDGETVENNVRLKDGDVLQLSPNLQLRYQSIPNEEQST